MVVVISRIVVCHLELAASGGCCGQHVVVYLPVRAIELLVGVLVPGLSQVGAPVPVNQIIACVRNGVSSRRR